MLHIAKSFSLPLDAITQTFAILAKRGVGKTYTAKKMCEEMLRSSSRCVAVDPIGVWHGLRVGADGRSPGLSIVVLGGEHGDVPLDATSGSVVANMLADENIPAVLDLSLMRKNESTRFMSDFAEGLYHKNRKPLHLFVDEADAFAPQRPMPGEQRLLGAMEDIVRRGRARGLGCTMITQRAAVLNKNVLTQIECLITLRTVSPQDRAAIDDWIKVHGTPEQREEMMASLASLPIGSAWFWSPGWLNVFQRVEIGKLRTYDSSATPTSKTSSLKLTPTTIDLEKIQTRLAASIQKAEQNNPLLLRRHISELERKLQAAASIQPPDPLVLQREYTRGYERGYKDAFDILRTGVIAEIDKHKKMAVDISATADNNSPRVNHELRHPDAISSPRRDLSKRRVVTSSNSISNEIGPAIKLLQVLVSRAPIKLTRSQLGTLAGLSARGGTFGTYLSKLRTAGCIEESQGLISATEYGIASAGEVPPKGDPLETWVRALGPGTGATRMLIAIAGQPEKFFNRQELADISGTTASGGTFGTYLSKLRANGLIEERGREIRASQVLFM